MGCDPGSGFFRAHKLAFSADGASLYLSSWDMSALFHYQRGADGTLSQQGVYHEGNMDTESLYCISSVRVEDIGERVYVASECMDYIGVFTRSLTTGALLFKYHFRPPSCTLWARL